MIHNTYFSSKERLKGTFLIKINDIFIVCLHLDDTSKIERKKQIESLPIKDKMIIGGDFNEDFLKESKLYTFIENLGFTTTINKKYTYILDKCLIDNIFVKELKIKKSKILNNCKINVYCQVKRYGSDHFPIIMEVEIS